MENELHDLLVALDTQIDGVESYLRKINEIGNDQRFHARGPDGKIRNLGVVLRVSSDLSIEQDIYWLRKQLQQQQERLES